jgi:signal peptidase I
MARNHYDDPMTTNTEDFTTLDIVEIAKLERDFSRAFLIVFIFAIPVNLAGLFYFYPPEKHFGATSILFVSTYVALIFPGVKFSKLVDFIPKYRHVFKVGYFLTAVLSPLVTLIVVSLALSIINDWVFRRKNMPVGFFGGILEYSEGSEIKIRVNNLKKRHVFWSLGVAYFCILAFIIRPSHIIGMSMAPTLQLGELIILNLWDKNIKPNDIVEMRFPVPNSPLFIKRVVAVGGDKVKVTKGVIYVNGVVFQDENIRNFWKDQGCFDESSNLANVKESTVPADSYYVVGDNRTESGSEDSRVVGAIPKSDIIGKIARVSLSKPATLDYCQQYY